MRFVSVCSLILLVSCGSPPPVVPAGPATLSEWHLFTDFATQTPAEGVVPYDVIAPLFSDYATKHRFIRVPAGMQATIDANGDFVFPEGTVIVKTFGFIDDLRDLSSHERLIETRLLVRQNGGWVPLIYRYDDDMREARLYQYGQRVDVAWTNLAGNHVSISYRVPDAVQCANCHGGADPIHLLGVRTRQLDRMHDYGSGPVNQLDHFVSIGILASTPAPADRHALLDPFDTTLPVEGRARSYLEANCANCHRPNGGSDQSGLWLGIEITDPVRLGICKDPAAAGLSAGGLHVDIQPRHPELSVMSYRVHSDEPGIKMPELPTILHHEEGADLIDLWINSMPEVVCGGPDSGVPPVDAATSDAASSDASSGDAH